MKLNYCRVLTIILLLCSNFVMGQQVAIIGTIKDANTGGPLPGASVLEVGTTNGTISDFDGNFKLKLAPNTSISISFIGYETKIIETKGKSKIDVVLSSSTENLDELVVIGYGSVKKSDITGSVAVTTAKEIENRPVANASTALQGLTPGLQVSTSSSGGAPGASKSLSIRGSGTPLVLIDGIEGNMDDINPDDIETFTVLKDAASSAIYGARAAYGVVLVTTKSGKDGITVKYSNNIQIAHNTNTPNMVDSKRWAEYFNLASTNDGRAPIFSDDILAKIDEYMADPVNTPPATKDPNKADQYGFYTMGHANTDWYDVLYKDWSMRQQHNLSVSGANDRVSYYTSLGFYDQEGQIQYIDDKYQRYNFNSRLNIKVNDWLSSYTNVRYNKIYQKTTSYNTSLLFHNTARLYPTNSPVNAQGQYIGESEHSAIVAVLNGSGDDITNFGSTQITSGFSIEPIKGWVTKAELNYRGDVSSRERHNALVNTYTPSGATVAVRSTNGYYTNAYTSTYIKPSFYSTYSKDINGHDFSIMAGYEFENYRYEYKYLSKNQLVTDQVPSISTGTGTLNGNDSKYSWGTQSVFGRFNYNYKNKYLLNVNFRADATSKFSKDNQLGAFPSLSLGYDMAKEEYWQNIPMVADVVSQFKPRFNYGSLGNQNGLGNYTDAEILPINTNLGWIMGDERPIYTSIPGMINTNLTWETVTTIGYGLDIAMLNNRFTLSADWYKRTVDDLLGTASADIPGVLGTNPPKENNAAIETKGWEINLGWSDDINEFHYFANLNLFGYNKVFTKYNNETKLLNSNFEGKRIGDIWGYRATDGFLTEGEASNMSSDYNGSSEGWYDQSQINSVWGAGDVKYVDQNGDGIINKGKNTLDDHGDMEIIGNSIPDVQFGINLGASWRGVDFSIFLQGVAGKEVWLGGNTFFGMSGSVWQATAFEEHMDYWTPENPNAYYARPLSNRSGKNQQVSDKYLQDAGYLRLKNLQVGYTFPTSWTERVDIKKARIYFSGENLLTFTKLSSVYDPEAISGGYGAGKMYPLQMVLSGGVSLSF
ncbi:TonB-dependent receptor [Halosquirtibacter laminarini]|uniref:TonB-dependent receptor n=1 Tax=Halosquirtibacter laminarini TaxID=3374600 RepID=A0AC61NHL4_9BACT|nr:TonB-dependent receptor [Prolixibacteraceae bacterium]